MDKSNFSYFYIWKVFTICNRTTYVQQKRFPVFSKNLKIMVYTSKGFFDRLK